jgi:prephenate dehydratase
MAEEIRQVEHYSVSIPDKAGEAARVLRALRDAGINLIAFWGYHYKAGRGQLEFIPENGAAFVAAAKQAKLKLSKKRTALYFHGEDRPGAVAGILEKLAAARINLGAVQSVCGGAGRYGTIIFLTPTAVRKAANLLGPGLGQGSRTALHKERTSKA